MDTFLLALLTAFIVLIISERHGRKEIISYNRR